MENNYSMLWEKFIPVLTDKNEIYVYVKESRDVYIKTIEEDIKKVFQIADIPNLTPSINNWKVKNGEEKVILHGNLFGIGTTREIGYRNDPLFYKFKHKNGTGSDISRVNCILYCYEEFVVIVDLWSYNGTDVIINRLPISSVKGKRKLIKITNTGEIILRRCSSAQNIIVTRIKNKEIKNDDAKDDINVCKSERTCVICMNNPQTHLIIPCGHKCLCEKCSVEHLEKLTTCPICREKVQHFQRVFEV
jgi:hypothetical protein